MIDVSTMLLGPMAGPECAMASRRGWVIWVRILPAFVAGSVAFVVLWLWSMSQRFDPYHQPFYELRTALTIIEGMLIAFALILAPAVLAGSLAGEKERGSIGLLLTTRVNAAEIVLGRLVGRLSQVAMIEMAALPCLLMMAWMAGLNWLMTLTLIALPTGVAFGSSGIALAASAMSRRGRDALLLVYLIDILFLLSPLLASVSWTDLKLLSPFECLEPLTWRDLGWPAQITAAIWAAMGVLGLVIASWRLRPACLAEGNSEKARKRAHRRGWVPPLDDRPMLWKELYIERVGTLGRAGRWIGGLLVLWMALGSIGLAVYAGWGLFVQHDQAWVDWSISQSSLWYGNSARYIGFLIQWAIGLRAAVTISSERERGTWDALLTSPLEGTEIVRGKLWGSLWALKWLILSAVLAWTITLALGGMFAREYVQLLVGLATIGTFMSAVGVRTSLHTATATRSMGITIGSWLGAYMMALMIATIVCTLVVVVCVIGWLIAIQMGLATFSGGAPWFPMSFSLGMDIVLYGQFLAAAIFIVAETRVRFDRVAGRMTGGKTAVAIDRLIHGIPMAPVLLDPKPKVAEPELDEVAG